MRDIEFRGKDIETGEWFKGQCLQIGNSRAVIIPNEWLLDKSRTSIMPYEVDADCREVLPATVGQYTGRKDKNGKIFEGDIVKREVFDGTVIGVVKFKPYRGWYLDCRHKEQSVVKTYYNNGDFVDERVVVKFAQLTCSRERNTVIGSIHDNPELLEQQG